MKSEKKITCKYYRTFISMVFNFARTQFKNNLAFIWFFYGFDFQKPKIQFWWWFLLIEITVKKNELMRSKYESMNPVLCNLLWFFLFHLLKTDRYYCRKQSSKIRSFISNLYCICCVWFYFPFYIYKVNFWLNMSSCHADVSKWPLTNWWIYYHHCYSSTFVVFMSIKSWT